MRSYSRKKTSIVALVGVVATAVTACGGATVENSPSETSIAPLTRSVAPSSDASASPSEDAESSTAAASEPGAERPEAPLPQDQPAQEVSEIPDNSLQLSGADREYLDALKAEGVDVEGVEDQLIGTASVVCGSEGAPLDGATIGAVAGQLIEQGRTTKAFEELVTSIDSSARKAYC